MTGRVPRKAPVTERSWEILKRCYRSAADDDVIERALIMLANADRHLNPDGTIKGSVGGRPVMRRPR